MLYIRPESGDASFNWEDFCRIVNTELVNNIGNFALRYSKLFFFGLVIRVKLESKHFFRGLSFVKKFFNGVIPKITLNERDNQMLAQVNLELNEYFKLLEDCRYSLNILLIFFNCFY